MLKTAPVRNFDSHHEAQRMLAEQRPVVAEIVPTENSHWLQRSGGFKHRLDLAPEEEEEGRPDGHRRRRSLGYASRRKSVYAHEELAQEWGLCLAADRQQAVLSNWQAVAGPWN